ncbi:hypothetical protein NP493_7g07026 [Ridgeia piscesae]|uniref:Uncharacterized protein n=1 Tax=Ridgeia piscesae TaxID=27915 RepID=A0AAD9PFB8_RIDPI|nr:hypothetical protein NP493_7g07026 [Ridgeia piscesae]
MTFHTMKTPHNIPNNSCLTNISSSMPTMSELKKVQMIFIKTQHVFYNYNGLSYLHFHMFNSSYIVQYPILRHGVKYICI